MGLIIARKRIALKFATKKIPAIIFNNLACKNRACIGATFSKTYSFFLLFWLPFASCQPSCCGGKANTCIDACMSTREVLLAYFCPIVFNELFYDEFHQRQGQMSFALSARAEGDVTSHV